MRLDDGIESETNYCESREGTMSIKQNEQRNRRKRVGVVRTKGLVERNQGRDV